MIALLDIDGTLVDSNYQHALAWFRAFRDHGVIAPVWECHRAIGMGGDQLVTHVAGEEAEERSGDAIRAAEGEHYARLVDEVQPLPGARELVLGLKAAEHTIVMASSAKPEEVEHYLDLLAARTLADAWTGADDVQQTKPKPDLVLAALEKATELREGEKVKQAAADAVMVGDSVWDVEAAARAKVRTYAVLTGGFSEAELTDAGAEKVFGSVQELVDRIAETDLG